MLENVLRKQSFYNVMGWKLDPGKVLFIDLSVNNTDPDFKAIQRISELDQYIQKQLQKHDKKIACGGYAENRLIYHRLAHFNPDPKQERSLHLGVDVWTSAYSSLYAPLAGEVHSFQNNGQGGDYGGTIILQHYLEGSSFYTLYGHLSRASLKGKVKRQVIEAGERFAELGDEHENGGWPPHLHFQIIEDMEGKYGDYPGVVQLSEKDFYLRNCPNPDLILGL